ncbi:MAG: dihydrofolate reductase family protein, partial [Nitrospinota bacterium]
NLLAGREVRHLLVEGGGRVHAAFLDEGLADRVMAFIAPMIIGDSQAPGAVSGGELHSLEEAPKISHVTHEILGCDILIQGYLNHPVWADFEESPDV